ncbi:MAG: exodeoxyribonuclease VII small subunit [Fimbriiglobus sp.]|nr:exodeoxyribonuclease VII small subunit [Fimbriiglobus sp.]
MTPTPDAPRFEQAMAELERILRELEDGTATLEESLAKYERGVLLVRTCQEQLAGAEQKIRLLAGVADDGKPDLKEFAHTAAIEKAKPKRNGKAEE